MLDRQALVFAKAVRSSPSPHESPRHLDRPMTPPTIADRCALAALSCVIGLAACQGDGSEIGPNLGTKPPEPFQVQVLDDRGEPVCGARVTTPAGTAITGRAGRAESPQRPSGANLITIAASAASAADGDDLQGLAVTATSIDGDRALERPLYLPDAAASNGLNLSTGVQAATQVLDDVTNSGGVLIVGAGSQVSDGGSAAVTLRTARLEPRHLPVSVPAPPGHAALVSRGIFVSPPTATFAGVELALPDDLGASTGGGPIDLLRLDERSGTFALVGSGVGNVGRISSAAPGIDRGGLYVFAAATQRVATLRGRVVDGDGRPQARVFVLADGRSTTTAADGSFELGPLAALDLGGDARTVLIDLVGGRGSLPLTVSTLVDLADGPVDLGDRILDTRPSAHLRLLLLERGVAVADRILHTTEALGRAVATTFAGADGTAVIEDLAEGFYGITFGRTDGQQNSFRTQALLRIRPADRIVDANVFSVRGTYDERRRGNTVQVFDADGGGPVQDAVVVRGDQPEQGFVARTFEGGVAFLGLASDDQVTAVSDRSRYGQRAISACTAVATSAHRIELPVHTLLLPRVGSFERHGLVAARIAGGTPGGGRELRIAWPLRYRDWFERVMLDAASAGRTPVKLAPTADADVQFTAGVPLPRGHLALVETRLEFGTPVVDGAFVAFDLAPAEGSTTALTGQLSRRDTDFTAVIASGGPPSIGVGTLTADWGAENAAGTIADVARGTIPVGTRFTGGALTFTLPALSGVFAGGRHLVCVHGSETVAGVTREQRQVIPLTQPNGNVAGRLLGVPELRQPAPGAVVDPEGFTVEYTLPADATFALVRLRSDGIGELREWTALLPATASSFTFRRLPGEAAAVLAPGLTWRLEVTAYRVLYGPLALEPDIYTSVLANFVTLGPADLGVDALSRISITVTTP